MPISRSDPISDLAVLVIDLQECFVCGGSLEVPFADSAYIADIEECIGWLAERPIHLFASRDYHPEGHVSFASSHSGSQPFTTITLPDGRYQELWPDHAVQTRGDSRLIIDGNLFDAIIRKGEDPRFDSQSAFQVDLLPSLKEGDSCFIENCSCRLATQV